MSAIIIPPTRLTGRSYPSASDVATLVVEGRQFGGWTNVEVSRSLGEAAATFGFGMTARWPSEPNPARVRPGQSCQVWLGQDLVVNGYIDAVAPSYSDTGHTIQVTGRSATGQLVDCSCVDVGPQFRRMPVSAIASALTLPYDVPILMDVADATLIDRFVLEPEESVFEAIARLAGQRGLLITDTPEGWLLLTRAGSSRSTGALVCEAARSALDGVIGLRRRGNILAASASFDITERYSEYRCRGQSVGSPLINGLAASQPEGVETDDGLTLRRVLKLRAEGNADPASCQKRATWEAAVRAGKSVAYDCTVQGWRQTLDGPLWKVNELVPVDDKIISIDVDLLVVSCSYVLDDGGTRCSMKLAPPDGYLPEPPRKARKGSAHRAAGGYVEIMGVTIPTQVKP